jgi:hypothetical protein
MLPQAKWAALKRETMQLPNSYNLFADRALGASRSVILGSNFGWNGVNISPPTQVECMSTVYGFGSVNFLILPRCIF